MMEKWFVASKRVESNEVVVVPGADHPALCCRALKTSTKEFSWIAGVLPEGVDTEEGMRARCQVRHRMRDVPVVVRRLGYVHEAIARNSSLRYYSQPS
jgi:tRNA U34 2-thiouridine synthase MnmA/TrmU